MRRAVLYLLVPLTSLLLRCFPLYTVLQLCYRVNHALLNYSYAEIKRAYKQSAWFPDLLGLKPCLVISLVTLLCADKKNDVVLFLGINRLFFRERRVLKGHCWVEINDRSVSKDDRQSGEKYLVLLRFANGVFT